jgi:hypothetical protein
MPSVPEVAAACPPVTSSALAVVASRQDFPTFNAHHTCTRVATVTQLGAKPAAVSAKAASIHPAAL